MTQPLEVLSAACDRAGFSSSDAQLLHAHSNTVYLLPSIGVVARINGNEHAGLRAKASLTITRWLADHDLPVTEPALDRPVDVAGSTVTFWTYYPQYRTDRPSPQHLGEILAHLHTLLAPLFPLPDYQPLIGLVSILTTADITPAVLSAADRRWLSEQAEQLINEYRSLPSPLGRGLVHGDAYTGNILWDGDKVRLGNWDETSIAPRELDLTNTVQARRFGIREADIDAFLRAYGHDPRGEPLFDALVRMRDLHTLTSDIRRAQQGDARIPSSPPGSRACRTQQFLHAGPVHDAADRCRDRVGNRPEISAERRFGRRSRSDSRRRSARGGAVQRVGFGVESLVGPPRYGCGVGGR